MRAQASILPANLKELSSKGLIWLAEPGSVSAGQQQSIIRDVFAPAPSPAAWRASPPSGAPKAVPLGIPEIDRELPGNGLAAGAVHEFCLEPAPEQRELLSHHFFPCSFLALLCANALKANPQKFVIWIGKHTWPTPFILQKPITQNASQALISKCIFVNPPSLKLLLWSLETALRSDVVAAVVANLKNLKFALSQRFMLDAKAGGGLALIVRKFEDLQSASAAASRWSVKTLSSDSFNPLFELSLHKLKGQKPSSSAWQVSLCVDNGMEFVPSQNNRSEFFWSRGAKFLKG